MDPTVLHVTTQSRWDEARRAGSLRAETLDTVGFIHCATLAQLDGVLGRFFRGQTGLVVLHIEPAKLTSPLKYEPATDAPDLFPHVYGPINVDAVNAVTAVKAPMA